MLYCLRVFILLAFASALAAQTTDPLVSGFEQPPRSAKPLAWWHWINGNVTKEGIDADLESFKAVGLGGVQLFDVEIYLPPGPVRYGSPSWHDHVRHAMAKAAELGLEFHVMNTPGWSASGGPWITPERSMKKLVHSETNTAGGSLTLPLKQPDVVPFYSARGTPKEVFYRDIAVLAVPVEATPRLPQLERKIAWAAKPVVRPAPDLTPAIASTRVIDLTGSLSPDGVLRAELPPGEWTVLRFGYTTTGKTNHPAVPEGQGLEVDKLDAAAVAFQFEKAIGPLLSDAGSLAGPTFNGLLFDSFEGGFQNWSAGLPEEFARRKGYSLIPWLPALTGRVLESPAATEAVLWDFRDVIDALLVENYFGTMRRLGAQHGLQVYAESQGGPLNPMTVNRQVDVPMNEFWTPDATGRASRIKQTVSSAAFYGRPIVGAEAFTSTPENGRYQNTPASMKRPGDQAFAMGLNRFALHSVTHQPVTEAAPGFSLGRYGVHFGRLNTWWPLSRAWFDYLARSQLLLQQGRIVADVCLLIDDDLGYGLPASVGKLTPGFTLLACLPAQLEEMSVEADSLTHPLAGKFRLLATPDRTTAASWVATNATLRRIHALVTAGAHLAGPPPTAPAGLADLREHGEFERLVTTLWGPSGDTSPRRAVGRGFVYPNASISEALAQEHCEPDLIAEGSTGVIDWLHRVTADADLYFVFNNSADSQTLTLNLRQSGRRPEFWDAKTGQRTEADVYEPAGGRLHLPVTLEPWGSTFVVFRKPRPPVPIVAVSGARFDPLRKYHVSNEDVVATTDATGSTSRQSLPALPTAISLKGPWQLTFVDGRGAPPTAILPGLMPLNEHANPDIRHYSGRIRYQTTFTAPRVAEGQLATLELGTVADIARVTLNGHDLGTAWAPPFRLDATLYLKEGPNELTVEVANRWVNRLIGDEAIPETYLYQTATQNKFTDGRLLKLPDWLYNQEHWATRRRHSFSTWQHYSADSPLVPSGLIGPVRLEWVNRIKVNDAR